MHEMESYRDPSSKFGRHSGLSVQMHSRQRSSSAVGVVYVVFCKVKSEQEATILSSALLKELDLLYKPEGCMIFTSCTRS